MQREKNAKDKVKVITGTIIVIVMVWLQGNINGNLHFFANGVALNAELIDAFSLT